MQNKYTGKKLDRMDKKILHELQTHGRISYVDLSEKVGLSTSPCLERVRRLERDGYIKRYAALLDPHKIDAGLLVFVEIKLDYTSPTVFEDFKAAVRKWPQIQECYLVSGNFDYLIKARIANMIAYRALLGEILHTLPGVRDSRTLVVMEEVKESTYLNLVD